MKVIDIYIPVSGSSIDRYLESASAIVGCAQSATPTIYYEGNRFGAQQLSTWISRVHMAAGRSFVRYPTSAMQARPTRDADLVRVGEAEQSLMKIGSILTANAAPVHEVRARECTLIRIDAGALSRVAEYTGEPEENLVQYAIKQDGKIVATGPRNLMCAWFNKLISPDMANTKVGILRQTFEGRLDPFEKIEICANDVPVRSAMVGDGSRMIHENDLVKTLDFTPCDVHQRMIDRLTSEGWMSHQLAQRHDVKHQAFTLEGTDIQIVAHMTADDIKFEIRSEFEISMSIQINQTASERMLDLKMGELLEECAIRMNDESACTMTDSVRKHRI